MAETTALSLADLILFTSRERNIEVTNLKLQKLLYYSQAWHLAILGKPLFLDRIEAWIHGPVVPPVFGHFKEYRWNPIPFFGPDPGIELGDAHWSIRNFIGEVMEAYGTLTGPQLERLTHEEDPWKKARAGIPSDQPSNNVITHESMIDFYRPMVRRIDG